ncbi:AbiH family protein [Roseivirga sp.]|uniref:AbiH family protein n=1 Tax=Roseivirga sp. TaxID=1964215 RepID=UPI003B52E0D8
MNVVYIIGNGFDLNLGLKTRYSDFYPFYKDVENESRIIKELKKSIDSNIENWSDLELALGKYTKNIKTTEEFDEIFEDLGDRLAEYLEIEYTKFNKSEASKESFLKYLGFPEMSLPIADRIRFIKYIQSKAKSKWSLDIMTFNYTKTIEDIIGPNIQGLELERENKPSLIINGIHHIHGFLDRRMIMGVNDNSQVLNDSLHSNDDIMETIIKSHCNSAYRSTIEGTCRELIYNANLICVFGSSMGETDKLWWDAISHQISTKDCILLVFSRTQDFNDNRAYKYSRLARKIKKRFLTDPILKGALRENVSNKILMGLNTDMFKIQ